MRITIRMLRVQTNATKHLDNHIITLLLGRCKMVDINWGTDNITDCHTWVQTGVWILEYNLHFLTIRQHILCNLLFFIKNNLIIINNSAARWFIETEQCTSCCCLTASGLTNKTKCFTSDDKEGNIIYSLNIFLVLSKTTGRKVLLQMFYLN